LRIDFDWKKSNSVFGPGYKPVASVGFETSKDDWEEFQLKIDSGAVITLMNPGDCLALGYKLEDGDRKILNVADNTELAVRVHKIRIKIGNRTLPNRVRIAFAERPIRELLLGRLDVFDHFEICLNMQILQSTIKSGIRRKFTLRERRRKPTET
jgi:hypothetical protein